MVTAAEFLELKKQKEQIKKRRKVLEDKLLTDLATIIAKETGTYILPANEYYDCTEGHDSGNMYMLDIYFSGSGGVCFKLYYKEIKVKTSIRSGTKPWVKDFVAKAQPVVENFWEKLNAKL